MRSEFLRSHAWQVSIGRFIVLLLTASLVGVLLRAPVVTMMVALFGYSVWSLVSLYRIQSWLHSRRRSPPPEDWGVWSEVSEYVYRKLHGERSRKRRLIELLRAFREAAAALPDGVVVLATGRTLLWCNEAASRLIGISPQHQRGERIDDFLPPAARDWIARDPSEPLTDVESLREDGVRLSFRHIAYSREQSLLVVRDITHLSRLEQVRRDFVANVSHELRTPLTVLHGYLDMLEPTDAPEWAPVLDDLRAQSRRMAQIVEDLLTLSRLEAQVELAPDRISMRAMLANLKRDAEGLSQGRHTIRSLVRSEADLAGSLQYLQSAFSNLVSNAVRYTPPGGTIELRWESSPPDGDGARFVVQDTGYGIPAEHLPRVTERFYRVSTSRSRATGGTGLGLSIVKHVLNLHHARLDIESEVGVGSTFSCVFDAAHLLPATPRSNAAAEPLDMNPPA